MCLSAKAWRARMRSERFATKPCPVAISAPPVRARWARVRGQWSSDVIDALTDLLILRGPPALVRSDNRPEFVATGVRAWIETVGAKSAFIEPGLPWENGYVESCKARIQAEPRDGEIFFSLRKAQIIIEGWRTH